MIRSARQGPRALVSPRLSVITCSLQEAQVFETHVLPSILSQSCTEFEWVIVNPGGDLPTRRIVEKLEDSLSISYVEMTFPTQGCPRCYARNIGLLEAQAPWVAYVDAASKLNPDFMSQLVEALGPGSCLRFGEVGGSARHVLELLFSPTSGSAREASGFLHRREQAPRWNPNYRESCVLEYLLQCIDRWGNGAFQSLAGAGIRERHRRTDPASGPSPQEAKELLQIWRGRKHYPALSQAELYEGFESYLKRLKLIDVP